VPRRFPGRPEFELTRVTNKIAHALDASWLKNKSQTGTCQ